MLYGALLSPFVRKVALVVAEKGIACTLESNARANPDFAEASPFGKIPAIRDGTFTLADSSAIAHYLEAKCPTPALIPAEAEARARTIWFDEYANTLLAGSGLKVLFNRFVGPKILGIPGDEAEALKGIAELPRFYDYLEAAAAGPAWLAGEAFTLADIAVAVQLCACDLVQAGPDAATYPAIAAWYARVSARPAWISVVAQAAAHASANRAPQPA